MRIFENANYDFLGKRRYAFVFSAVIISIGLVSLLVRGISTGIDFQGGTEFVFQTDASAPPVSAVALRQALTPVLADAPEVKRYGSDRELLVRTVATGDIDALQQQVLAAATEAFPEARPQIVKVDVVGPRFAEDLKRGAILSVLGSLLVIFLYVAVRFQWTYSVGAIAALAHDVLFTLGMFSLLQGVLPFSLQIDQAVIAAFLTIVGYSVNDTVIVFDRIREYRTLFKAEPLARTINRGINATLSRTFITSGTTLLTVLVLFLFAGEVIRPFAFALLIGIGIGTYSSIFVAAPVVLALRERAPGRTRVAPARA